MHALCVLVMACAVAAGAAGGTAHGEARAGALAAALTRGAQPVLRAAAVHPALHAVIARSGRPRGTRASHASPPPVALAAAGSHDLPRRAITEASLPAEDRRAERPIRTGSARGPPIA